MSQENQDAGELSLSDALALAIHVQRRGELDAAEELYRRVLAVWPDCPDALHFSGLLAFQRGNAGQAILLIEKSVALAPEHADFWNNFGNVLKAQGRKPDSTAAYLRAIELRPQFADAHNNLGVMASQQGDFAGAAEAYQKAIAIDPRHAAAHLNLGSAFARLDMLDDAVAAYDTATRLNPMNPEAYGRLGQIFWRQGKLKEATDAIVRNTEMSQGDPMAFVILAGIFYEQGRIDESIEAYQKAVEIDPKDGYSNRLLGMTLVVHGRSAEAHEVWKKWRDADPENPVPRHLLEVGSDDKVPARAADDFVVRVFDGFAESFDTKLRDLEYRAPDLVAEALRSAVSEPAAALDILDAGCGTGLCGPLLRPFARLLDGVDLSPAMLEKAKARGGYDSLAAGELTAFMHGRRDAYNAIISADTLCYFGQLDAVFSAAASALREGGHFIFTVETTPPSAGAAKCTLEHTGRYTHTEEYVRSALAATGLNVVQLSCTTLRLEYFRPVAGMVVAARKAGKSAAA